MGLIPDLKDGGVLRFSSLKDFWIKSNRVKSLFYAYCATMRNSIRSCPRNNFKELKMPKVLVAGEKAFFIHAFTVDELRKLEISQTRNDSIYALGRVLDDADLTAEKLESVKPAVMMLLKQSETYKKAHHNPDMDGFILLVFRAKNVNAQKNYIATWCGQSDPQMLAQNPSALIEKIVQGFHHLFNPKDYHKKSTIHQLLKKSAS
jgi:hypothetical protein